MQGEGEEFTMNDIEGLIGDLRNVAISLLSMESNAHSVRPTALVHTALRRCKLKGQEWEDVKWKTRKQFFSTVHGAMRNALVDYARRRNAGSRPKIAFVNPEDIDLYNLPNAAKNHPEQIIALEESLHLLGRTDKELVKIVEHHYFTGLSIVELSKMFDMSEKTIKRRLQKGRVLLHAAIMDFLNQPTDETSSK